jgi:ketosteroid isomerase-like protein
MTTRSPREARVEAVRTFFRLLEEKDIDAWMDLWADDADHYYPYGTEMFPPHLRGREAIRENWEGVPGLFDSLSFALHDIWCDGDTVIVRLDSDNVMKGGDRRYRNTYICVFTFDRQGLIRVYREYFDPIVTGVTYGLAEVRYR